MPAHTTDKKNAKSNLPAKESGQDADKLHTAQAAHENENGHDNQKDKTALQQAPFHSFGFSKLALQAGGFIQTKLSVNTPGDEYEQEADAVAEKVMRAEPQPETTSNGNGNTKISGNNNLNETAESTAPEKEDNQPEEPAAAAPQFIQRKLSSGSAGGDDEPFLPGKNGPVLNVPNQEDLLLSAGRPLDRTIRAFMERRFVYDFSKVRIHDDTQAHNTASRIQALAYTWQNNIFFAAGYYRPNSHAGRRLLAHELTHVIQQGFGQRYKPVAPIITKPGRPPGIQRDVPDDVKLLPDDKEKVLAKNLEHWKQFKYDKVLPLRQITPETAPNAYANHVYAAQKLIRQANIPLDEDRIAADGILGPRTFIFLSFVARSENQKTLAFQLSGLGFDMDAIASKASLPVYRQALVSVHKIELMSEWDISVSGEQVLENFSIESEESFIKWTDDVIFDGPAKTLYPNADITIADRYAILKKLYNDVQLKGRAAIGKANRAFIDLHADTEAMVMNDPRKPGKDPLRISYAAGSAAMAKKYEDIFNIVYPNKKTEKLGRNIGPHTGDGEISITGLLLSFYLPVITATERARIDVIRQQYIDEKAKDVDQFAQARALALISLVNDDETSRYILPGKIRQALMGFYSRNDAFERLVEILKNEQGKDYFVLLLQKTEKLGNMETLQFLVELCNRSKYKNDPDVQKALKLLQDVKHEVQSHDYVTGTPEEQGVWIEKKRDADSFLKVGDVTKGWYRIYEKKDRLEEKKRKLLEDKMKEIVGQRIQKSMDEGNPVPEKDLAADDYMKTVLEDAAKAVGITEKDIESVSVEEAFRLKGVKKELINGVEEFFIDYERVARIGGEGNTWEVQEASNGYHARSDFEEAMGWYKFNNSMKNLEKFITIEVIVIGGVGAVVFLASGGGAALIALGGGAKMVGISIAISVLIYAVTADHLTIEGFLKAALEGYLMAVGFRLFAPLGAGAARWIGTATFRSKLIGMLVKGVIVGGGAGAFTGAGSLLAGDIIAGKLHSPLDYLKAASVGFVLGAMFELGGSLILGPLFRATGKSVLQRISNMELLQEFFTKNSIALKPRQWADEILKGYIGFSTWCRENLEEKLIGEILKDAREKAAGMLTKFAEGFELSVQMHALELIEGGASREAIAGLDALVSGAKQKLGTKAARGLLDDLLNTLTKEPKKVNPFLGIIKDVDANLLAKLLEGRNMADLLTSDGILTVATNTSTKEVANLLQLHFDGHVNDFESWSRGLITQSADKQARILQLLKSHGGSVTPESLLRVAESGAALSDEVIEGLSRIISDARMRGIKPANIDSLLLLLKNDKIEAFLSAAGKLAKNDLDDILSLTAKPEQAARLINFTTDTDQLLRLFKLGGKNADEIEQLILASKGKFPAETESLLNTFAGNTKRVTELVKRLDGDAALLDRSITRMNRADVERVLDRAALHPSTNADPAALKQFMEIAESQGQANADRLVKFIDQVNVSQGGALPTTFAKSLTDLKLMIRTHPKTMLPFDSGSSTVLARPGSFHEFTLADGTTLRIEISELDLYHYQKGHLSDKFSFANNNLPPRRPLTTFWPEGTTIDFAFDEAMKTLKEPSIATAMDAAHAGGENWKVTYLTVGSFDYKAGIDLARKRFTQFFPNSSAGGAIPVSGDILVGIKAFFNL